jgi:hypothetical protein
MREIPKLFSNPANFSKPKQNPNNLFGVSKMICS